MRLDVTQTITKDNLIMDPCPYFSIMDALPQALYDQLAAEYPEAHMMQDQKKNFQARRYRQHELVKGTITPLWQEFIEYHTSQEYKDKVLDLFEPAIDKYYAAHKQEWRYADVIPRHHEKKIKNSNLVELELQFVLNGCQDTTVRTTHLDNAKELFAGLLYMRKPEDVSTGGDIQVFRKLVKNPIYTGIREVDSKQVTAAGIVPYRANTMILFLNTIDTLHGVTPRIGATEVRRYINIDAHQRHRLFQI